MLTKSLFALFLLAACCSAYIQRLRFTTRPVRRDLQGRVPKTRETRHEHQPVYEQGVISVSQAIQTDSPRALRRALRQFRDRPLLYVDLQLLALETAKTQNDKDWVFDIVDAVNIADLGLQIKE